MKRWRLILLLGISVILVLDLLHPGFPFTHDGRDHIVRIANFYESLQQGILIPRWGGNLNWGYGHPVMEFLYPLPSYIASAFHFIGFSLVNSYKLVLALGIIASSFAMYLWLRSFLDPVSSTLGAFLYMFAPYRMVDAYVRGDIGENLAFLFVPLVLWAIRKVVTTEKIRYVLWGGAFWAGVILAHNAIAVMFLPVAILYAVILLACNWKKSLIWHIGGLFALGFGLASFFWIPAVLEGKYTLRNVVTAGLYLSRFVKFQQLVYGPWNYGQTGEFTLQLGIANWIGLVAGMIWGGMKVWNRKIHSEIGWLVVMLILASLASIFLMLPYSAPLWQKVMLLQNFQFPWRFLSIDVFTTATLVAIMLSQIKKYRTALMIGGICLTFLFQWQYFHAQSYISHPDSFFSGIWDGTTDTGESTPIWSIRWMEQYPDAPVDVLDGKAHVVQVSRSFTKHDYIVTATEPTTLMENTLYFPGWHIYVDGKEVPIQYQDRRYVGQMTFTLPQGTHQVEVVFKDTKVRIIGEGISIVSIGILIGMLVFAIRKKIL